MMNRSYPGSLKQRCGTRRSAGPLPSGSIRGGRRSCPARWRTSKPLNFLSERHYWCSTLFSRKPSGDAAAASVEEPFVVHEHNSTGVPVLAVLLWYTRRRIAILSDGTMSGETFKLLMRAGRRCVEEVKVTIFHSYVQTTPEHSWCYRVLADCQGLRTVIASHYSHRSAEALCAAFSTHSDSPLTHLHVGFSAVGPWTAPLPSTVQHLSICCASAVFNDGLSEAIARCCPSLPSLSITFGRTQAPGRNHAAEHDRDPVEETSARLAMLIASLLGLRSLLLSDMSLREDSVRALCAAPTLTYLQLSNVDCMFVDPRSLAPGLPHLHRLVCRSSFLTTDGKLLAALLRAAAVSPHFCSLDIFQFSISRTRWRSSVILPALRDCVGTARLRELSISPRTYGPKSNELVRAVVGAARTLRSLSLMGLRFDNKASLNEALRQLAHCSRLEHLWWDTEKHVLPSIISTVAAAAPCLVSLSTDIAWPSTPSQLTEAAVQELHLRRQREATRSAWAVVRIGLEKAQERRIRNGHSLASPLFWLPASVLRHLDTYLDVAAQLRVVLHTPFPAAEQRTHFAPLL